MVSLGKVGGAVGKVVAGIVGNGGRLTFGIDGTAGCVCNRWRAAIVVWVLESEKAMMRERRRKR